jgi:hypothetical protein
MAGLLRTFAGTAGGGRWLLFAREQRGEMAAFALKALVSLAAGHHVLAELSVGERELAGQVRSLLLLGSWTQDIDDGLCICRSTRWDWRSSRMRSLRCSPGRWTTASA